MPQVLRGGKPDKVLQLWQHPSGDKLCISPKEIESPGKTENVFGMWRLTIKTRAKLNIELFLTTRLVCILVCVHETHITWLWQWKGPAETF